MYLYIHARVTHQTKQRQNKSVIFGRCGAVSWYVFWVHVYSCFFHESPIPSCISFFQLTTTRRKMNNDVRKEEVAEEKDARRNTENSKVKFPLFY